MSLTWNNGRLIRGRSDEDDTVALVNELRDKMTAVEALVPAIFTSLSQGEVPASGGGSANFLRADATWAAPTVSGNSRVFLGARTGVAANWFWDGLNGDAAGLAGYEIVGRTSGAAAVSVGLRFNSDAGANYGDIGGVATTSAHLHTNGGGEVVTSVINIPMALSGVPRVLTASSPRSDATPAIFAFTPAAFVWNSNAAITRIDLIEYAGGPASAATWALYALMDLP